MKKTIYTVEEYSVMFNARHSWRNIKYIIDEMDENILSEDYSPETVFKTEDKKQAIAYFKKHEPKYIKVERQNSNTKMCATGAMLIEYEVEIDDDDGMEVDRINCGTLLYSVKPKMYRINFLGGDSRYSSEYGVDYMMTLDEIEVDDDIDLSWEEAHLYSEVEIEIEDLDDDGDETCEADDRHYEELRDKVIAMDKKFGIDEEQLIFYRD